MYGDGDGKVWDRVARPHRDCMCYLGPPTTLMPIGMRKSPDVSPRRLSDISPQLRQLKYLVVDEAIKEDLKSSRSVEDINSASIEERILRITGYYGYQPWSASYKSKSPMNRLPLRGNVGPLFQGWGSDSTQAVSPTGNVTVGREVSSTFSTAHHCRHYKNEEGANDWKYMLCWSIYFIVITDWLFHSLDSLDFILANL